MLAGSPGSHGVEMLISMFSGALIVGVLALAAIVICSIYTVSITSIIATGLIIGIIAIVILVVFDKITEKAYPYIIFGIALS